MVSTFFEGEILALICGSHCKRADQEKENHKHQRKRRRLKRQKDSHDQEQYGYGAEAILKREPKVFVHKVTPSWRP